MRLIIGIESVNTHIIIVEPSVSCQVERPAKSINNLDIATKIEFRKMVKMI